MSGGTRYQIREQLGDSKSQTINFLIKILSLLDKEFILIESPDDEIYMNFQIKLWV